MRILMTNHALKDMGGTESWTQTMSRELLRQGHDVTIYTMMLGRAAELMPPGATVVEEVPDGPFDLILVNHNTCLGMVQPLEGTKIFTSHGPFHPIEKFKPGADAYVAVSEEVWACGVLAGMRPTVIRNPIDMQMFAPMGVCNSASSFKTPTLALFKALILLKNREACLMAQEACLRAGFGEAHIAHREINPIDDMASEMPKYDAVLGGGRGILEALACGCAAFQLNSLNTNVGLRVISDGWATLENMPDFRMFNCSSRYAGTVMDVESLSEALKGYQSQDWGRSYIQANNEVFSIVGQYLALAEKVARRQEVMVA